MIYPIIDLQNHRHLESRHYQSILTLPIIDIVRHAYIIYRKKMIRGSRKVVSKGLLTIFSYHTSTFLGMWGGSEIIG